MQCIFNWSQNIKSCRFAALAIALMFLNIISTCSQAADERKIKVEKVSETLRPENYSLEYNKKHYFPLGFLWDRSFTTIPQIGYNLTEKCCCLYDFNAGKEKEYKAEKNTKGKYLFGIWAAHTLFHTRKTKNYGELKNSIRSNGKPNGRHNINYFDPRTRKYVLDCAAKTTEVSNIKVGPQIFIWGIDNEYELPHDYSEEAKQQFYSWLEKIYNKDITRLNSAWGTEYTKFSDAVAPKESEYKDRPGAWLDWRAFQEEAYTDFIADFFKAIHEADPQKRPVISKSTQCTIEMCEVSRMRVNNHEMLAKKVKEYGKGWFGIDLYGHGDRNNYELNYLYNCIVRDGGEEPGEKNQSKLFVAESTNHAGPGWQFAQLFWRNLANGVKGINFFCLGRFGGSRDEATFGFTDHDGVRRSRFYYAGRFATMIHRNEKFWSECAPVKGLPKIALLMPFKDVVISTGSRRSWWDYPVNNRLKVYGWLRSAGYWVDVIPYNKISSEGLKPYYATFLVGANHLGIKECKNLKEYVENGGVLVADELAGYYDEHHIVSQGLKDVLGVDITGVYHGRDVSPDDIWYNTSEGMMIRGDGKIKYKLTTAANLNQQDLIHNGKNGAITLNRLGKGTVLWFNTRLGVLRGEQVKDSFVSDWLAGYLKDFGIAPAYTTPESDGTEARVEMPMKDSSGNCAIIVAGNSIDPLSAGDWNITASPEMNISNIFFADAEHNTLEKITAKKTGNNKISFTLPEFRSAGVIYMFPDSNPVIGIDITGTEKTVPQDKHTPLLNPGDSVEVNIQLVNMSDKEKGTGKLKLILTEGWKSIPEEIDTAAIGAGATSDYKFKVTLSGDIDSYVPNKAYPVIAQWKQDGKLAAVSNQPLMVIIDPTKYTWTISDNAHMELERPLRRTGTTYSYPIELKRKQKISDPAVKGSGRNRALVSGLNWWSRQVKVGNIKNLPVLFDLKAPHKINTVSFVSGHTPSPASCDVSVSNDGKTFKKAGTITGIDAKDKDSKWNEIKLDGMVGQYVKLEFKFKNGGFLDEVVITGSPLTKNP